MSTHSCAVCVTIYSNSSIILPGFKLHTQNHFNWDCATPLKPQACTGGNNALTSFWVGGYSKFSCILLSIPHQQFSARVDMLEGTVEDLSSILEGHHVLFLLISGTVDET